MEPFCQNGIFKAGMGVITELLNMVYRSVVKEGTFDAKSSFPCFKNQDMKA